LAVRKPIDKSAPFSMRVPAFSIWGGRDTQEEPLCGEPTPIGTPKRWSPNTVGASGFFNIFLPLHDDVNRRISSKQPHPTFSPRTGDGMHCQQEKIDCSTDEAASDRGSFGDFGLERTSNGNIAAVPTRLFWSTNRSGRQFKLHIIYRSDWA
jgi:hypothetical protein